MRFLSFSLWLALLALPSPPAHANLPALPDLGAPSDDVMTPTEERRLGEAFFRNLHQQIQVSEDPEIQDYISSLGNRLVSHSDMAKQRFHFFVVMEPSINAFAGPAGYIGVHAGLILATRTESELASVMAHEIAHVTQHHLKRAFAAASRMTLPMAAATLAAILLGTQSPAAAQAALIALQAGSLQSQINFTRAHEQEADRIGLQILAASKFNPRSMPAFFERLQQSTRFLGYNIPEFLRTHPVTSSRIADTRSRADTFPYRQYTDSLTYLLAKRKLQVLTANQRELFKQEFRAAMRRGTPNQKAAAQYGLALILGDQHQFDASRKLLLDLLATYPDQPQFIHALAQVEIAQGKNQQGLKRYQEALRRFPGSNVLKLEYAGALLASGRFRQAKELIEPHITDQTKYYPVLYKLLSQAYAGMDETAEGQRYLAEYFYAIGDLKQAIRHARLAVKMAQGNRILSAIVKQRLLFFQAEERAMKH